MKSKPISIVPFLHKQVQVSVLVNNHQPGFMQAPDGRQMYLRHTIQAPVFQGKQQIIVG